MCTFGIVGLYLKTCAEWKNKCCCRLDLCSDNQPRRSVDFEFYFIFSNACYCIFSTASCFTPSKWLSLPQLRTSLLIFFLYCYDHLVTVYISRERI